MCFSCNQASASGNNITVVISPSAGFTGGTTLTRPTATDEIILISNAVYGVGTDVATRWSVLQSTDGQCTRVWVANSGSIQFFWAFEKPVNTTTGWSNPSVSFVTGASPPLLNGQAKFGATTATVAMGVESIAATTVANEIDGSWPMVPIGLSSSTVGARGRHGTLQDIWWGSTNVTTGDTYPNDATNQFVQIGNIILPWNGGGVNLT